MPNLRPSDMVNRQDPQRLQARINGKLLPPDTQLSDRIAAAQRQQLGEKYARLREYFTAESEGDPE